MGGELKERADRQGPTWGNECRWQKAAARLAGSSPRCTSISPTRPSPISTVMRRSNTGGAKLVERRLASASSCPCVVGGVFTGAPAAGWPPLVGSRPCGPPGTGADASTRDCSVEASASNANCSLCSRASSCLFRSIRPEMDWRSRSSASAIRLVIPSGSGFSVILT